MNRRPCNRLLWVAKRDEHTMEAECLVCRREHLLISGWEDTVWADGPMEPVAPDEDNARPLH